MSRNLKLEPQLTSTSPFVPTGSSLTEIALTPLQNFSKRVMHCRHSRLTFKTLMPIFVWIFVGLVRRLGRILYPSKCMCFSLTVMSYNFVWWEYTWFFQPFDRAPKWENHCCSISDNKSCWLQMQPWVEKNIILLFPSCLTSIFNLI